MNIWTVLKTLLFTTIMLLQSILSTITYSRPVAPPNFKRYLAPVPTHSSLALSTLRTLSHLSFVITKFGGVTSTSSAGFAELKRVFYSALDVLSVDVEASETFAKALSLHGWSTWILLHDTFTDLSHSSCGRLQRGRTSCGSSHTRSSSIQPGVRRTTGPPAQPRHYRTICLPFVSPVRIGPPLYFPFLIHFFHQGI
jgi:hypothetical protein